MAGSSKRTSDSAGKQKRKPGSIDLNTARQMLPLVRSIVTDLVDTKAKLQTLTKEQGVLEQERRHLTWESRQRRYALTDELVQTESQYSSVLNELNQLGVAVVDPVVGMVDFPTRINGRPAPPVGTRRRLGRCLIADAHHRKGRTMFPIAPPMPLTDPGEGALGPEPAPALIALCNRTLDHVAGYSTMVEKAEASFRDTAERFRALHARHGATLTRMLAELDLEGEADGTIMGTVHKAVVTLRAVFDDIDADVMGAVRSGEDATLKAFDDAIAEARVPIADLQDMRSELTALLDETQDLG